MNENETYDRATRVSQQRIDRDRRPDDEDDGNYVGDDFRDDLTASDYRKAASVLTGRAVDLISDEEERHYAIMKLASQLGIMK